MKKLTLTIRANEGYSVDQVNSSITVKDLMDYLEGCDPDSEIITCDANNRCGAKYGVVVDFDEEIEEDDEEIFWEIVDKVIAAAEENPSEDLKTLADIYNADYDFDVNEIVEEAKNKLDN